MRRRGLALTSLVVVLSFVGPAASGSREGAQERGGLLALDLKTGEQRWYLPPTGSDRLYRASWAGRDLVLASDYACRPESIEDVRTIALETPSGDTRWQSKQSLASDGSRGTAVLLTNETSVRGVRVSDGATRWKLRLSGPGVRGTTRDLVLTTVDHEPRLLAHDRRNGEPRWEYAHPDPELVPTLGVVAVGDQSIVISNFGIGEGVPLIVLDTRTGSERFRFTAPGYSFDAHVVGSRIVSDAGQGGYVEARNLTGGIAWHVDGVGSIQAVSTADDTVYALNLNGGSVLRAIDVRDGHIRWTMAREVAVFGAARGVVVIEDDFELQALDAATGRAIWKRPIPTWHRVGEPLPVTFGPDALYVSGECGEE